jgi:DNA-binding SARP family transcriptional activator/Tfp pilus assembly protein PilF
MEFCLLGPLLVRRGKTALPFLPGKQRVLLATLLLRANRMVSLDELTEMMWGSAPPISARSTLRNYVKELRKTLAVCGDSRLITVPGGYQIRVTAAELDLSRFDALQASARTCAGAGAWNEASVQLREALSLWRGEPLADVPSEPLVLREVPRLAELRLQAIEARIEADLQLGRHADMIAELRHLCALHPFRERLRGQLMLALYRDGRQAEALAAYADARRVLVEELGAEPGTGLRELHHQILTASPMLEVPEAARSAVGRRDPPVPRELPAGVAHFTGRTSELAALSRLLGTPGDQMPGTVVISAIGGTAGVGKTALAVQWAHQAAEHFPDGQLYVNLRGYDPAQPVVPADALAGFLRSLGVAGQDVPAEEAERAARYRSLLARRRMLIVLDNAGSAEQVRPLLPGDPACAVVVTSRDALTGLVARDGARRLDLDLLPLQDAIGLLRALIGARVDADPAAAAVLASQCCRLPLALRVAAELAASRPSVPLAELTGELADQQRRLDLLDAGGDPRTGVRAVFSWSYQHLDADTARAFRLLGLHPGPDLDSCAAAALTSITVPRTRQVVDRLVRADLVHTTGPGRHGQHDLLRAYACELAAADDEAEQRAALTRLFDHYLHSAATAMDVLYPAERHRRPRILPPAAPGPPMTDPAAARAWLDSERTVLVAVAAHAADCGWPSHATRLAATVFRYLDDGGHYPEAIAIHTYARQAARRTGDRAAEAEAVHNLSVVDLRQGRYQQAVGHLQRVLALYRQTGDQTGQARALNNLGIIDARHGHCRRALGHLKQALALYRQTGDRTGEARALQNLGMVDAQQGRYQRAADYLHQALALSRETGNPAGEVQALNDLGLMDARQGHLRQAAGHLDQALTLSRETGNRAGEARALTSLGEVDQRQGCHEQASDYHWQALALFRQIGDRCGEADALNGLGEVLLAIGEPVLARTQYTIALDLANQNGDREQQARAHNGLAGSCTGRGDHSQARHHLQQALTLYTSLDAPEADQVKAQLAAADIQGE